MTNSKRRGLRILFGVLASILLLLAGTLVWLVFLGGITITDRAMLWKMLRDQGGVAPTETLIAEHLRVPTGYRIELWASDLPSARLMVVTERGDLLLTQPRGGRVVWLAADRDGDGRSDAQRVLFEGLDRPNGIDLHEGWLYIAEATRVFRVRYAESTQGPKIDELREELIGGLTADGSHWRKTVRIGPDGALYLGQGSTCNVCLEKDPRRATMMRFPRDGGEGEIIATGTRNPYGFDWAPWDQALYATENGRDLLGDDLPPDELNRIEVGGFYGWPYRHGRDLDDPQFSKQVSSALLASAIAPAHEFRAHVAPLGIRFLRHPERGAAYDRAALVALHGSWNRSTPDGYAVVSLHFDADGRVAERVFIDGFRAYDAQGKSLLIGRPVDVVEGVEGEIYVSDDYAGVIYRVSRLP